VREESLPVTRIAALWMALCGTVAMTAVAAAGYAASVDPASDASGHEIATREDGNDRMTVGVRIDGRGPFAFVVDTGAERTVISTELAGQLRLAPAAAARLLTLSEISTVPTVMIPTLTVSKSVIEQINAPALAREHIGAAGILGIDTLQDQRIMFDFKRGRMTIAPSSQRDDTRSSDDIVVRARSRFGRLVLADASAEGQRMHVIIDTGAQLSVGNPALLKKLLAHRRKHGPNEIELRSVTGGVMLANFAILRNVRLGDVHLENMPVAITDSDVFHRLDLDDRPALLLGMDVLRAFDRVSVDFANRKVRFLMPGNALLQPVIQNAANRSSQSAG
jgi:predicted aspartyl protease